MSPSAVLSIDKTDVFDGLEDRGFKISDKHFQCDAKNSCAITTEANDYVFVQDLITDISALIPLRTGGTAPDLHFLLGNGSPFVQPVTYGNDGLVQLGTWLVPYRCIATVYYPPKVVVKGAIPQRCFTGVGSVKKKHSEYPSN